MSTQKLNAQGMPEYVMDPADLLDFVLDWTTWLAGDTIATSAWTVPAGITKDSDVNTPTTATIWLRNATLGKRYVVTNHITTAGGRGKDQSIEILCRNQ